MHSPSAVPVSQPDPPPPTAYTPRGELGLCARCGGPKWRSRAITSVDAAFAGPLEPWQKLIASSAPGYCLLLSCAECAPFAGLIGGRRREDRAVHQAEAAYQRVALAQLVRAALELAQAQICRPCSADYPLCGVCLASLPTGAANEHKPGCNVGAILHFAPQVSSSTACVETPAAANGRAGDFLGAEIRPAQVAAIAEDWGAWPVGSAHAQADGYSCSDAGDELDGGVE